MDEILGAARLADAIETVVAADPLRFEVAIRLGSEVGGMAVEMNPSVGFSDTSPAKVIVGRKVLVPIGAVISPDGAPSIGFERVPVTRTFEVERGEDGIALTLRTEGLTLRPTDRRKMVWLPGGPGADVDWTGQVADGWSVLRPAPHVVLVAHLESAPAEALLGAVQAQLVADRIRGSAPYGRLRPRARQRQAEVLLGLRAKGGTVRAMP